MSRIPVTILGGYLGVGKTTMVNHILRHANGRRLAVLINDFGTLPIDADLIEADEGDLLTLAGGCVCCSYGDDLVRALIELAQRTPAPDHVVIETSGVALPGAVARSLNLLFAYQLDAIAVVADAVTTAERLDDAYMGDTLARQFADADLIIVNKSDLVSAATRAQLEQRLATGYPSARLLTTSRGVIDPAVILGAVDAGTRRLAPGAATAPAAHATTSYQLAGATDLDALATCLSALDLVRAKGFIAARSGAMHTVHLAGKRVSFEVAPDHAQDQRLVCIAIGPTIDRDAIAVALACCGLVETTA